MSITLTSITLGPGPWSDDVLGLQSIEYPLTLNDVQTVDYSYGSNSYKIRWSNGINSIETFNSQWTPLLTFGYQSSDQTWRVSADNLSGQRAPNSSPMTDGVVFNLQTVQYTNNVFVDFSVQVNADSSLDVFGSSFAEPNNLIIPAKTLPLNALYDPLTQTGLLEYWEESNDPSNIYVKFASTNGTSVGGPNLSSEDGGAYNLYLKRIGKAIQRILCDEFNCEGAIPFNASKYNGTAFTTPKHFGRLALSTFCHFLFGHVDATVAVTNEIEFMKNMLSLTGAGADAAVADSTSSGPANRFSAFSSEHLTDLTSNAIASWTNLEGTPEDSNLAKRLAHSIYLKGTDEGSLKISKVTDNALTEEERKNELAYIVKQVAGADATRLINSGSSSIHRALPFFEGDVIYVTVQLNTPSIVIDGDQSGTGVEESLQSAYSVQTYNLKLTVGPSERL